MSKPILMLGFGLGWCASSPLLYTLQRNAKYVHAGYTKSFFYLQSIDDPVPRTKFQETIHDLIEKDEWIEHASNFKHPMNLPEDWEPIKDFPLSHLYDLTYKRPRSIDIYIEFYKHLYNHVSKKGYKAVGDFGSKFSSLHGNRIDKLQQHFHLKGITILRDPIRRAWSSALAHNNQYSEKTITDDGRLVDAFSYKRDYVGAELKKRTKIPDCLTLVAEELYEGDGSEKKRLEDFINQPIPELWPNLYSPDIGHHLTWDLDNHLCPTPCQIHGQSDYILTPEYYMELKETTFKWVYKEWIDHYGSLPLHWGEPIDYSKNLDAWNKQHGSYDMSKPPKNAGRSWLSNGL